MRKVREGRLKAFITSNLLQYLHGEVSDRYFLNFLTVISTKGYLQSSPRFSKLLPNLKKVESLVKQRKEDKAEVSKAVIQVLDQMVNHRVVSENYG